MKTKEEIIKDIEYLFKKINWGTSFLDAKAITIMNELRRDIMKLEIVGKVEDINHRPGDVFLSQETDSVEHPKGQTSESATDTLAEHEKDCDNCIVTNGDNRSQTEHSESGGATCDKLTDLKALSADTSDSNIHSRREQQARGGASAPSDLSGSNLPTTAILARIKEINRVVTHPTMDKIVELINLEKLEMLAAVEQIVDRQQGYTSDSSTGVMIRKNTSNLIDKREINKELAHLRESLK